MPVIHEAKPPGIPAWELRAYQLARIVSGNAFIGMVVTRVSCRESSDMLVEVGGPTLWTDLVPVNGGLPNVEILPNGSTLTVTENE